MLSGVHELYNLLPNFGVNLALDSKIINSYAIPYGNLSDTILKRAEYLMADKGNSGSPFQNLLKEAAITPIIDHPHKWQGDGTMQYLDTDLIYNQSGEVFWVTN